MMLYIIPTPIGNLGDMTYRAVEVLKEVDFIACEDTRHSLKLLNHYDIKKPLISFHKFNVASAIDDFLSKLQSGKKIALISDAGMPCISDPGCELISACIKNNIQYTVLPGATAFVNAVILSDYSKKPFAFIGFLPEKNADKDRLLEQYRFCPCSLVFYASPHNIQKDIQYIFSIYGDRKIAIVKELTKIHEKIYFSTLEKGISDDIRGEYVLIVEGKCKDNNLNELDVSQHLQYYIDMGLEKKQAIKQVASDRGVHKSEVYKITF